jgi:flagellin-specific chaperone FliS
MDIPSINNKLLRAQDIIAELRAALDMIVEELAVKLERSYEYFQYLLTQANIKKELELLVECVELMMICMILGKSYLIIYRKRIIFLNKNQRLIYMGRLF